MHLFLHQIDLAHGSPNGYPPVTWMAAPRQAHHMLQSHPGNAIHWHDEHMLVQQQQRLPPIVSAKESSVRSIFVSLIYKKKIHTYRHCF